MSSLWVAENPEIGMFTSEYLQQLGLKRHEQYSQNGVRRRDTEGIQSRETHRKAAKNSFLVRN